MISATKGNWVAGRLGILPLLALFTGAAAGGVPDDVRTRSVEATVKVTNDLDGQTGSGVTIAHGGDHAYVLTSCHIVPTAKKAKVLLPAGKTLSANVIARSEEFDLAVLRHPLTEGASRPIKLAKAGAKPKSLLSVGWAKGDSPTGLDESLKGLARLKTCPDRDPVLCWETTRKPAPGRSGGPLVDETGAVVGVTTGHDTQSGFFIHIDAIHTFLRQNGLKWIAEE